MTLAHPDVWSTEADQFPASGARVEKLAFLLNYAVMAPSGHNSQPWMFKVHPKWIDCYADRTRALPVVDPDDRELTISVGCAIYNLRLAMRRFGMTPIVELLPDPDNPDLMATVRVGDPAPPTDEEVALFDVIATRRTNRHRFEEREVAGDIVAAMQAAAEGEGAWLAPVVDEARMDVATMIADADERQMGDKMFRRELASWIHPRRRVSHDGMPAYDMGIGDIPASGGAFVLRTFEMGDTQASLDYRIAMGSPALAVLGTAGDSVEDWINTGQALARLLLVGAAAGLSASYLNQPVEIPELRPRVAQACDREGFPQLILRMGYGPEVKPTPRRPLSEVML